MTVYDNYVYTMTIPLCRVFNNINNVYLKSLYNKGGMMELIAYR